MTLDVTEQHPLNQVADQNTKFPNDLTKNPITNSKRMQKFVSFISNEQAI